MRSHSEWQPIFASELPIDLCHEEVFITSATFKSPSDFAERSTLWWYLSPAVRAKIETKPEEAASLVYGSPDIQAQLYENLSRQLLKYFSSIDTDKLGLVGRTVDGERSRAPADLTRSLMDALEFNDYVPVACYMSNPARHHMDKPPEVREQHVKANQSFYIFAVSNFDATWENNVVIRISMHLPSMKSRTVGGGVDYELGYFYDTIDNDSYRVKSPDLELNHPLENALSLTIDQLSEHLAVKQNVYLRVKFPDRMANKPLSQKDITRATHVLQSALDASSMEFLRYSSVQTNALNAMSLILLFAARIMKRRYPNAPIEDIPVDSSNIDFKVPHVVKMPALSGRPATSDPKAIYAYADTLAEEFLRDHDTSLDRRDALDRFTVSSLYGKPVDLLVRYGMYLEQGASVGEAYVQRIKDALESSVLFSTDFSLYDVPFSPVIQAFVSYFSSIPAVFQGISSEIKSLQLTYRSAFVSRSLSDLTALANGKQWWSDHISRIPADSDIPLSVNSEELLKTFYADAYTVALKIKKEANMKLKKGA